MRRIRQHLTYANVIATIGLFVALGGGAYAISIGKNDVRSKHIGKGQVKTPDLAKGAVIGTKVRDGSLGVGDFAPNQIPAGERGPEGPPGPTEGVATDALAGVQPTPEGAFGETDLTTGRDGRLFVFKHVTNLVVNCTSGLARVWLRVDGVKVEGSLLENFTPGPPGRQVEFAGVTAAPIPAGTHTARVVAECTSGDLTGATIGSSDSVTAIVLGG
jgi:hypothetical protein